MSLTKTNTITPVLIASVGQTVFAYTDIRILVAADLEVSKDGVVQTLTTDYSVTGVGDEAGGTVIFVTPMTGGEEIVIRRVPALTQASVYPETGKFPSDAHEQAIDKLTMIAQYLNETDERTPKWPSSIDKTVVGATLPDPTINAGKVLAFDASGIVPLTILSTDIASPLTTKGDILTHTTIPARLATGSDGTVLMSLASEVTGKKNANAAEVLDYLATTRGDIIKRGATSTERMPLVAYDEYYGSDGTDLIAAKLPWTQGQCRLILNGSNIQLIPYNGNQIIMKTPTGIWKPYTIPSGGVSLAPTGLTASSRYLIYAQDNGAGAVEIIAVNTDPVVDPTHGFMVMDGDSTHLLVGLVFIDTGPAFADTDAKRYVRSYYNDPGVVSRRRYTTDRFTTSTTYVELNSESRVTVVAWEGEDIRYRFTGSYFHSAAVDCYYALGVNSLTVSTSGNVVKTDTANIATASFTDTYVAPSTAAYTMYTLARTPSGTWTFIGGAKEGTSIEVLTSGRKVLT